MIHIESPGQLLSWTKVFEWSSDVLYYILELILTVIELLSLFIRV